MSSRKFNVHLELLIESSILAPSTGFVSLGALVDGLYINTGSTQYKVYSTNDIVAVLNGGTGKNSVSLNSMLWASSANTYSEVTTSSFGRGLLNTVSGTVITGLNAQYLNGQLGTYYAPLTSLNTYLPLAGGTLTNTLFIQSASATINLINTAGGSNWKMYSWTDGNYYIGVQSSGIGMTMTPSYAVTFANTVNATSFNSITGLANSTPSPNGTGYVGMSTLTARQDHVHPTDTSRQIALTNPVTGTGTANYLSKFNGTSTLTNSLIYDNGTRVLIGSTTDNGTGNLQISSTSTTRLTVYSTGTIGDARVMIKRASSTNSANWFEFDNGDNGNSWLVGNRSSSSDFVWNYWNGTSNNWYMNLCAATGNVLFGSLIDNGVDKLQVYGSLYVTNTAKFSGGTSISTFTDGTLIGSWIDMPTTYASGIGSGGVGQNVWIGYSQRANNYFTGAVAGDINYRNTMGSLNFGNVGTQIAMQIKNSNILIGTTSDNGVDKLQVTGSGNFTSNVDAASFIKTGGTSSQFLKADGSSDSTAYLSVYTASGTYVPYGGATTNIMLGAYTITASNFITTSDERLKTKIKSIDTSYLELNYKEYELISKPNEKRYGVIAQDLLENNPELVSIDEHGMYAVNYTDLLIRKIAELEQRIKKLEVKL